MWWWVLLVLVLLWGAIGPWALPIVVAVLLVPPVRRRVRKPRWSWKVAGITVAIIGILAGVAVVLPDGKLPIPQSGGFLVTPGYEGRPAAKQPINVQTPPQHPFMAPNGRNSMHNDAWATDAYTWDGPLGESPEVDTFWYGIEECATTAFDSHDRMVVLCGDAKGPTLHVLDPETMTKLATMDLPNRTSGNVMDSSTMLCGGSYFYLDHEDRAVTATTDRKIIAVTTRNGEGDADLVIDESWDLNSAIPTDDCLIALMPDWDGRIWFESRAGVVGYVAPESGEVVSTDLGEPIANSFAVDEDGGVYVVSDKAFYRFQAGVDGSVETAWRKVYDRGTRRKPGQLSQGSGTTPTLMDDGIVAITDNSEPRMNVVFYDRARGTEVCKTPVFGDDAGSTDNSLVSLGDAVVVENNYGYQSPLTTLFGRSTTPGVARVDLDGTECKVAWTSDVVAPTSVPKGSLANGLVYVYAKRPNAWGVSAWYLTAIDARTGATRFAVRTGTGAMSNNHYAAITLGPDGAAYVATMTGMIRVKDRERSSN